MDTAHGMGKILVIEDDNDILTVIADQLELDGFMVFAASNGKQGLALFRREKPDLVLLDLNLPDMDGIKICRNLRKTSDVPIIMLTARDSLSDKVRGFQCGADDYIVKPFEYLELAARIRACLRRGTSGSARKEALKYGSLTIIPQKREVRLDGKPVKLTNKEFDLLELFISYPGEVLSRDFLCSQLWPQKEIYSWSRALDVHIQRLRKKIEPDPEKPRFIITHPGLGYRFDSNP